MGSIDECLAACASSRFCWASLSMVGKGLSGVENLIAKVMLTGHSQRPYLEKVALVKRSGWSLGDTISSPARQ